MSLSLFPHDRVDLRAATRRKAAQYPPPLPSYARGFDLPHRLQQPFTRAETARTSMVAGGVVAGLTIVGLIATILLVEQISLGGGLFLGVLGLVALGGLSLLWSGYRTLRIAHIPAPYLELDEIDLVAGGRFRVAFVQEKGCVLTDVQVVLVCDETIIQEFESPCSADADPAHRRRRGHRINAAGQHVDVRRVPKTSRLVEQPVLQEARVDASSRKVVRLAQFDLPPDSEPSGETADHKIVWQLLVGGSMAGGPAIGDKYTLRVRRPADDAA
jgi:hypothetical protein